MTMVNDQGERRIAASRSWMSLALTMAMLLIAAVGGAAITSSGMLRELFAPASVPVAAPAPRPAPPPHPALPRMELQAQYAGPLQDTVIQRLRDPVDGTICYVYLPVVVHHTPVNELGYLEYGANHIGTVSCYAPLAPARPATPAVRATAP